MLSTMKILMKNMMDLKLKQLQRKTTCCQKKITSHHLQGMLRSIIQLQCLMRRITMRMKKHPMIMSLLVIMLFKIFLQVILDQVPIFFMFHCLCQHSFHFLLLSGSHATPVFSLPSIDQTFCSLEFFYLQLYLFSCLQALMVLINSIMFHSDSTKT